MKNFLILLFALLISISGACQHFPGPIAAYPAKNDNSAPTVAITSPSSGTVGQPVEVTATVNRYVTGFTSGDLTLVNATVSNFTAVSGNVYMFTITASSNGTFSVGIGANKFVSALGVNNVASSPATLSWTYSSGSFTPTDADLWLDFPKIISSGITQDKDNLYRPNITSSDANAYTSTIIGAGGNGQTPQFNGEGIYLNGGTGLKWGTTSSFTGLHNGGSWTLYYVFKSLPASLTDLTHDANPVSASPIPIIRTTSATNNSQVGIQICYYHTSSSVNSFQVSICNGGGGTPPYQVTGSTNAIAVNSYNILKVTFDGTTLSCWVKQYGGSYVSIGTDNTGSFSTSASHDPLTLGATSGMICYAKHLVIYKSILSAGETTSLESYLDTEAGNTVTPTNVNVYLYADLSNGGSADNSGLAGDLTGDCNYKTFWSSSNNYASNAGVITEAWSGVNDNPATPTKSGYQLRFGHDMAALGTETIILGKWVGATVLIPQPSGGGSWSTLTIVNNADLYPVWMDAVGSPNVGNTSRLVMDGLEKIVHVLRKTPKVRAILMGLGEEDAVQTYTTQSDYFNNLRSFLKTTKDKISAAGYDIAKFRVGIIRIQTQTYINAAAVRAAQVDYATNGATYDPSYWPDSSYLTYINTDDLSGHTIGGHRDAVAQDSVGHRLKVFLAPYYNE